MASSSPFQKFYRERLNRLAALRRFCQPSASTPVKRKAEHERYVKAIQAGKLLKSPAMRVVRPGTWSRRADFLNLRCFGPTEGYRCQQSCWYFWFFCCSGLYRRGLTAGPGDTTPVVDWVWWLSLCWFCFWQGGFSLRQWV